MFCKKCGNEQKPGEKFCSRCGNPFNEEDRRTIEKSLKETASKVADATAKMAEQAKENAIKAGEVIKEKTAAASVAVSETATKVGGQIKDTVGVISETAKESITTKDSVNDASQSQGQKPAADEMAKSDENHNDESEQTLEESIAGNDAAEGNPSDDNCKESVQSNDDEKQNEKKPKKINKAVYVVCIVICILSFGIRMCNGCSDNDSGSVNDSGNYESGNYASESGYSSGTSSSSGRSTRQAYNFYNPAAVMSYLSAHTFECSDITVQFISNTIYLNGRAFGTCDVVSITAHTAVIQYISIYDHSTIRLYVDNAQGFIKDADGIIYYEK